MTEERARALVLQYGCKLCSAGPEMLCVINERINFRFAMWLGDLASTSEEAFISTITTGRPSRGQSPLPGSYRDAVPVRWF